MTADFEITVRAGGDDPVTGAPGARGASGEAEPTEEDFAHVRNYVKGALIALEGTLPPGWFLDVTINAPASDQSVYRGRVDEPSPDVVLPVDRFDKIKVDVCVTCENEGRPGREIVDQGDGAWYHSQPCANPKPGGTMVHETDPGGPMADDKTDGDGNAEAREFYAKGDTGPKAKPLAVGDDGQPDALHG